MEFKLDKGLGYMYCYNPEHPLANKSGKVYEHVYVMSNLIGRPLYNYECVHHIDRDRTNNDPDNLMLMTLSDHAKLHMMEDHGIKYIDNKCKICENIITTTEKQKRNYCSPKCAWKDKERIEIDIEELKFLVWVYPTTELSNIFGISDVAIAKRCKKHGISKPPRGYWSKLK